MSSGDDMKAGRYNYAENRTILGAQKPEGGKDFDGDWIFKAAPEVGNNRPGGDVDGIHGIGSRGGAGIKGWGGLEDHADRDRGAAGIVGVGGDVTPGKFGGDGVVGFGGRGNGLPGGVGVVGRGGLGSSGVPGESGNTRDGVGVMGFSTQNDAVIGISGGAAVSGVFGFNSNIRSMAFGVFGLTASPTGAGVSGRNDANVGVSGFSSQGYGVLGVGRTGVHAEGRLTAMFAHSATGHGITAVVDKPGKYAGLFKGDVYVSGDLTVLGGGAKSAAVRTRDGSVRRLYSMESPESWFEDFGEGRLRRGRTTVRIPTDFASVIRTDRYYVFVTPHGDCGGLSVVSRTRTGFEVRELNNGTTNVAFSYRIVAKRRDIKGARLARVRVPDLPSVHHRQHVEVPDRREEATQFARRGSNAKASRSIRRRDQSK